MVLTTQIYVTTSAPPAARLAAKPNTDSAALIPPAEQELAPSHHAFLSGTAPRAYRRSETTPLQSARKAGRVAATAETPVR